MCVSIITKKHKHLLPFFPASAKFRKCHYLLYHVYIGL